MTIDEFLENVRRRGAEAGVTPSFLVYTLGAKELFHGEVVDASSPETILLRQLDGLEVLVMRRHIVAVTTAAA